MGIFDNIKASVSSTMRQASDTAKTYADKNRVKKDIMTLEAEIANCCRDLGNQVYRDHKDEPDHPYQEYFRTISSLQAALTDKQRELNLLLGMQTCPDCGTPMALNVKFCSNCGAQMPVIAEPAVTQKVCAFCGQTLSPDALFCSDCGQSVEPANQGASPFSAQNNAPAPSVPLIPAVPVKPAAEDTVNSDEKPEEPQTEKKDEDTPETKQDIPDTPKPEAPSGEPQKPQELFCPNCGEVIPSDALFCACCGNKVPGLD